MAESETVRETVLEPDMTESDTVLEPDMTESDTVLEPDMTESDTVLEPDMTESDTVLEPDMATSDTVLEPDMTESDTVLEPDMTESDTVLEPDMTESDTVLEPDMTESDTVVEPDIDIDSEVAPLNGYLYDYNLSSKPVLLVDYKKEFVDRDNYLRGCKWSPDGTCLLCCSNDNKLRLFNLPEILYTKVPEELQLLEMNPVLCVSEGETIYDFVWFPLMSSDNPTSCCFASTSRGSPVHLYDAYNSDLRCSYSAFNHLDELVSPNSLCFSVDGSQLYTGYTNCIKIHNTSRPGKECQTIHTYNRKNGGQKGIISCISMNQTTQGMYALGSYSSSVGVYSNQVKGPIFVFYGLSSGVTQVLFSHCGNYLYSGERKNGDFLCWDLRNPNTPLLNLNRVVETNQRIQFDISRNDKFICSGNTNGSVTLWDNLPLREGQELPLNGSSFVAHNDAVNGCSIHPWRPLLATCSGQWTFVLSNDEDSNDEDIVCYEYENSIKLWNLSSNKID